MLAVIQNQSTATTDQQAAAKIPAYQKWLDLCAQDWWFKADLHFCTARDNIGTPDFCLYLRDLPGQQDPQGALGYHTKMLINGKMVYLGYSFQLLDIQSGLDPSCTDTHELIEGIRDPDVSTVWPHPLGSGFFQQQDEELADEPADTCEAEQFGMKIDGVLCSGWAFREWFSGDPRPDGKYDSSGQCRAPWSILPGGYIGSRIVNAGQWGTRTAALNPAVKDRWQFWTKDQLSGEMRPLAASEIPIGSRRYRRAMQATKKDLEGTAKMASEGTPLPTSMPNVPTSAIFGGGIQQTAADASDFIANAKLLLPKADKILTDVEVVSDAAANFVRQLQGKPTVP